MTRCTLRLALSPLCSSHSSKLHHTVARPSSRYVHHDMSKLPALGQPSFDRLTHHHPARPPPSSPSSPFSSTSPAARPPALVHYPAYCFAVSPTFNAWVKLTTTDVFALTERDGFAGTSSRSIIVVIIVAPFVTISSLSLSIPRIS